LKRKKIRRIWFLGVINIAWSSPEAFEVPGNKRRSCISELTARVAYNPARAFGNSGLPGIDKILCIGPEIQSFLVPSVLLFSPYFNPILSLFNSRVASLVPDQLHSRL
jgi:hypothetical protein